MFAGYDTTGERVPIADATLLAPSIPRSKVVGVGKNYRDHATEMGTAVPEEPLLFLKPNTSVIGPRRLHRAAEAEPAGSSSRASSPS